MENLTSDIYDAAKTIVDEVRHRLFLQTHLICPTLISALEIRVSYEI